MADLTSEDQQTSNRPYIYGISGVYSPYIWPYIVRIYDQFLAIYFFVWSIFGLSWSKFGPGRPPSSSRTSTSIEFRPSFVQFRPIFVIFDQFSTKKSTRIFFFVCWSIFGHVLGFLAVYWPYLGLVWLQGGQLWP